MANKKAEILTMDGQVVSPITLATNVLLDDGRTAQDLLDSRDESMFSPTITTSSSISKVGQGDNVDFSENVIDGAYKSCVLKGKTLVNYNAEGSDRNEYVCMPSVEGSNLTVNGTVEGKVKSAILKGQTLVNLVPKKIIDYTASSDWDGYHQLVQNSKQSFDQWRALQDLKPNTKYYISCYVETFEVVNNEGYRLNNPSVESIFEDSMIVNGVGRYQWLSTTKSELTDETFMALRCQNAYARGVIKIRDIMIIEYQDGMENWDIPYFEGMQSVKMPVLTTCGKNLIGECLNPTERFKKYKPFLKPETRYTLNYKNSNGSATSAGKVYLLNGETNSEITSFGYNYSMRFTTPTNVDDTTLLCIDSWNNELSVLLVEGEEVLNIDLEKILKEPYKSNILTVNEEVTLRGIGEVKDTLDGNTGELTQSIGEIVLDGSENWRAITTANGTYRYATTDKTTNVLSPSNDNRLVNALSNRLPITTGSSSWNNTVGLCNHVVDGWVIYDGIHTDLNSFKEWISQSPITIQFQLATESIKTVDLSDNHVYSYKDVTHYDCSSAEGSLVPTLAIEEGVKYKAIIKPSTKYSVVFNRTEVASGLTVDLGGATANITSTTLGKNIVQITTPPTLSHNYVIFKGLGNVIKDVQVIEGDVVGDEPYFEGMVDVKNPSVMNCNTLDTEDENYKSNTISTNEIVLRSLPNGGSDTLDLETGEYVQRIGEREYQVGDESNSQVLTDKVNTQYELATPITTTIDLKQHPFAYKDGYIVLASSSEEVSLTPTIEYSLIANRLGQIQTNQKLVEKQQAQIDELESMVVANLVNTQYQQALNEIKLGVK